MKERNPDFILIGAMRAGTSVTLQMLGQHYQIKAVRHQYGEIHFFDNAKKFDKGPSWYRGLFGKHSQPVVGEKSPRYMSDPKAMILIKKYCPEVKLIVILRDPTIRYISHRTFQSWGRGPKGEADIFWRGCYAPQLETVFGLFPRERVHIMFNEDLRRDTQGEIFKVFNFLGVEPVGKLNVRSGNRRSGEAPQWEEKKEQLAERYRPFNANLLRLLPERAEAINRWLGMNPNPEPAERKVEPCLQL